MPRKKPEQVSAENSDQDTESHVPEQATELPLAKQTEQPPTDRLAKAQRQEFFLPVSGFVWLYPEEVRVVDHPAFQRLGKIYQLGQTYYVYRGATHKRLEHALGALHIVQRMIDAVGHTSARDEVRNQPCGTPLTDSEIRFVRLGALLHDIGHIAAGHTVEDELQIADKHDHDARLDMVFDNLKDANNEPLSLIVDREFERFVPRKLKSTNLTPSIISRLLIRKAPGHDEEDRFKDQADILSQSGEIRLNICRDMIGNTICADLLDYLHRDWYHIGKPRPFDDRILQYMEIRPSKRSLGNAPASPHAGDQFAISLGQRPQLRTDAISAILELLEWRYQLAESVLFHRTKLAAAAMLDRALYSLWKENTEHVGDTLLRLSDEEMLDKCKSLADERKAKDGDAGSIASNLLSALQERRLFKNLLTFSFDDLPSDIRARVQHLYGKTPSGANLAPSNRSRVLSVLENDFQLPPGSLAMYCPTAEMNVKIADVKIAVGDVVLPFSTYENKHDNQLAGGHLNAQLHRFRRLWRIHFFIDPALAQGIDAPMLHFLRTAIEKLAIGNVLQGEDQFETAYYLATQLAREPGSPWHGQAVRETTTAGAYRGEDGTAAMGVAEGMYPSGVGSIASYINRK